MQPGAPSESSGTPGEAAPTMKMPRPDNGAGTVADIRKSSPIWHGPPSEWAIADCGVMLRVTTLLPPPLTKSNDPGSSVTPPPAMPTTIACARPPVIAAYANAMSPLANSVTWNVFAEVA